MVTGHMIKLIEETVRCEPRDPFSSDTYDLWSPSVILLEINSHYICKHRYNLAVVKEGTCTNVGCIVHLDPVAIENSEKGLKVNRQLKRQYTFLPSTK